MTALAAALALLCASSGSGAAQEATDTVSLRFAWPAGMTARVEQEWMRVQTTHARHAGRDSVRHDSTHVRSTYRLRVAEHPRGRLVTTDSFAVRSVGGRHMQDDTDDVQRFLARLVGFQPSFLVDPGGEFLGIEGAEQTRAMLDSLFAPLLREMADAPAELRALIAGATSPQALHASAAQEWNLLAGIWHGADWEVGAVYAATSEEPIPMLGGRTVPMEYEFSAVERVPCTEQESAPGAGEPRCVRLEMYSAPDTAALRTLTTELMARIAPAEREAVAAMRNMQASNELTVIAEPGSLRPHVLRLIRRVDVRTGQGEREETMTRVDTRRMWFEYEP